MTVGLMTLVIAASGAKPRKSSMGTKAHLSSKKLQVELPRVALSEANSCHKSMADKIGGIRQKISSKRFHPSKQKIRLARFHRNRNRNQLLTFLTWFLA